MDTNQEQRRQRRASTTSSGTAVGRSDVFDTHGNDLIRAHVQDANSACPAQDEAPSLLALAGLEATTGPDTAADRDEALTPEQIQEQAEEEEAEGVDVLADDEQEQVLDEVKETQLAAGVASMGGVAERAVLDRVQEGLDRAEVIAAREQGKLDELVQEALRDHALDSRDEVIHLLQRLMTSPREIDVIAAVDAIQLVEYLAEMIAEPEDLYALAAYDHADITSRIIVTDEAANMDRYLTPMARMMGGFAQILFQLVIDEFAVHPMPDTSQLEEREAMKSRREHTRPILFNILNFLRLVRSSAV
jgi:hypothetical protein